ncbi:endonuclease [Oceanobacillus chungangensis]|uniref:endonuclease n=1 Tax=Oceanobacillus chungangensis TaxID=1229152 RepID=UPI001B880BDB|nr:endonuclease [Oceanobacillus chungangensis]
MSKAIWRRLLSFLSVFTLVINLLLPTLPIVASAETVDSSDLIISEYIEGSSFNKAIELYNGTDQAINLSEYTLELFANGATSASQKLKLEGTLAAGTAYVLYHNQANDAIKAKGDFANNSVINFNGDDAIVLKKADNVTDSIGQVGKRIENLKDVTLVRNSNITTGDKIIDDAFDPAIEWTAFPKDDASNLGKHTIDGAAPEDPNEPGNPVGVMSIVDARKQATGDVKVKGIVTAKLKNTVHFQDETAALAIYPSSLDVKIGDEITVSGTLSAYNGLLQLQNVSIEGEAKQVGVPDAIVLTGEQLNEENESKLASVNNITIEDVQEGNGWANYTATDGTEFIVRDERGTLGLEAGNTYDSITGIVQEFNGAFQIIPRNTADIIADESAVQAVTATPGAGTMPTGTEVTLATGTEGATIYFTTNGDEPTEESVIYKEPIVLEQDTTIKAIAVKEGLKASNVASFAYKVFDQEAGMQIHDIQGESHESPLKGTFVNDIQGVVTYTYKIGSGNYFHFQTPDNLADDNPKTSEGIVVYTGNKAGNVEVGDLVSVSGTVDEYHIDGYNDTKQETDLSVTQINARDDRGGIVETVKSNVGMPAPIIINEENLPSEVIDNDSFAVFDPEEDAIDFWESLEGMLVEVGTVKAVAPQEHGDLITVLENRETNTIHGGVKLTEETANPDRIQFKLYDNNEARDFEVATGDEFTGPITGVVNYGFQNYKIYADLEEMQAKFVKGETTPETTTIEKEEDKLTVASYNLENFSNNKASSSDDKARKLARAFAKDMQSPDIIGVTEVQDNNGQDAGDSAANESYERLIQAIVDAGGVQYEYANIDPVNNADGGAPNANIRVGFLYNPERVTLTEGMPAGDATTAVGYKDGKLTHNPGRIDPKNDAFNNSRKPLAAQFDFQGESVIVIANHWNSKSGDTPLFGSTQPPVYDSEVQRKKIATIVSNFVTDIKNQNPEANIVSVGDFNDYQFTDALKIHEGEHMTNMINKVEDQDRYTYLFQGNSQVLDHILVSNNIVEETEIDILHINADFTDMAGRASDHDPVMVKLDLATEDAENPDEPEEPENPEEPAPTEPEKEYDFTNLEAKELVLHDKSVSITVDSNSKIKKGIEFTGEYAEFHGDGFTKTEVIINPKKAGAIIDFKGTEMKKVTINGKNVTEIRGFENIDKMNFKKGADRDKIIFRDSNGKMIVEEIVPKEKQDYGNIKTGKLNIKNKSVAITLGENAKVKNGIEFTGDYAEFYGDGFKTNTVTIKPKKAGAIIDFKGTEMKKVIIQGENVSQIRGAENVHEFAYKKGANADDILFIDTMEEPEPPVNNPPALTTPFENKKVNAGNSIALTLTDYFSDADGDKLTFTSTMGEIDSDTLTLKLEEGSHIVAITATDGTESITESFSVTVEAAEAEVPHADYYASAIGKEGKALKESLHEIIDDHHELSYNEVWDALKVTDEDPNNSNNVILLYSGESRAKNKNGGMVGDWNREHTWAKSHGGFGTSKGPGTDIHHLRPTDVQVNSSRGNLDFDNGGNAVKNCADCKRDGDSFEPPNEVKGDVARMLFYMAVRYEAGDRVDLELNDRVNNGSNPFHGKISVLLEWHEQDPVSEWEINRNNKIQEFQENRNPFIDNPGWAEDIWGEAR